VTEATEATAPIEQDRNAAAGDAALPEDADAAIAAFRGQLEGQVSVPAAVVQDCLLDLWAKLPEGEPRTEVERWLTETLERHLYAVSDVDARLESVFSDN
jgi:DNA-directed RNA polymerase specialized sigma24 family protein